MLKHAIEELDVDVKQGVERPVEVVCVEVVHSKCERAGKSTRMGLGARLRNGRSKHVLVEPNRFGSVCDHFCSVLLWELARRGDSRPASPTKLCERFAHYLVHVGGPVADEPLLTLGGLGGLVVGRRRVRSRSLERGASLRRRRCGGGRMHEEGERFY